jgi:hypothetical protein
MAKLKKQRRKPETLRIYYGVNKYNISAARCR